ncbi:unnamed protein product [Dimorphilus gyrociliatus]|uniref:Uncharacterized protein n=1 Tax=Dimorphilus gyrociliatus TaxID=2664684 RepID=A0A7I8VWJ0_9ANNE|nr:unnamed protein product [Dimorphilus gyrociliatus]
MPEIFKNSGYKKNRDDWCPAHYYAMSLKWGTVLVRKDTISMPKEADVVNIQPCFKKKAENDNGRSDDGNPIKGEINNKLDSDFEKQKVNFDKSNSLEREGEDKSSQNHQFVLPVPRANSLHLDNCFAHYFKEIPIPSVFVPHFETYMGPSMSIRGLIISEIDRLGTLPLVGNRDERKSKFLKFQKTE